MSLKVVNPRMWVALMMFLVSIDIFILPILDLPMIVKLKEPVEPKDLSHVSYSKRVSHLNV